MASELRNTCRPSPPPLPAAERGDSSTPSQETAAIHPEVLIHKFQQQAKLLEILETKLGPEGQALRTALSEAQQVLAELLQSGLPDEESV